MGNFFFFFFPVKVYSFICKVEIQREEEIFHLLPHFPNGCSGQLGQSKTGCQELLSVLPCGCRDPRTWAIFHQLPKHMSRELDWKSSG